MKCPKCKAASKIISKDGINRVRRCAKNHTFSTEMQKQQNGMISADKRATEVVIT